MNNGGGNPWADRSHPVGARQETEMTPPSVTKADLRQYLTAAIKSNLRSDAPPDPRGDETAGSYASIGYLEEVRRLTGLSRLSIGDALGVFTRASDLHGFVTRPVFHTCCRRLREMAGDDDGSSGAGGVVG
ncbi:unnamed protein product, partial [Discosporangium mesarthrocarpum]